MYKNFTMENLSRHSEEKMVDEFISFISDNKNAKFYHWGNFENYTFRDLNKRHNNKWAFANIKWVNLLSIFKSYPIVVRGAFDFSLKSIAKAMNSHGLISSTWDCDTNCNNGEEAMIEGWKCYRQYQNSQNITSQKEMLTIIKYNEIDCKSC
jgi:predicted RecB family nuclease